MDGWQGKTEILGAKPVIMPLLSSNYPNGLIQG
jgi:hypothetical protein